MRPSAPLLRFGGFELDRESAELLRSGRRVHLSPQAFQLLLLLADRPGVLVAREEIRRALWADGTFVDFEAAVNACVSQIRGALGDKATSPRFIETLPRRGYRFVAPVEHVVPAAAAASTGVAGTVEPARGNRILTVAAASMLVCVLALVAAVAASRRTQVPDYIRTHGVDALQRYERARAGLEDASPAELADRVVFFNEAIALSPDFAEAYAGIADAKLILAAYRSEDANTAYAAAKAAAAKALALNPKLADAHATFASAILLLEWNWTEAQLHFARALSLSSKSPRVHHWYARYLTALGRHSEAREHAEMAAALTPSSPSAATYLGVANFYAGDTSAARRHCSRALALMPEFTPARTCLAAADNPASTTAAMPDVYLQTAIQAADEGDTIRALDSLQLAANRHTDALIYASVQPGLRKLGAETRFQMVLERVGLSRPANAGR